MIKLNNKRILAVLAMVLTTMVWGITFEMVQGALRDAPPLIFATFRFGIGCLLGILYYPIKRFFKNRKQKKLTNEKE